MALVANVDAAITFTNTTLRQPTGPEFASTMASFLRPNDTTAYSIGDAVSDTTGGGRALVFPNCGRGGLIWNASLSVAMTVAADFDLFLFDNEPTNQTDNAAFALVTGDQAKLLGVYRFITGSKVNVGTNVELYRATSATTDQALPPIGYTTADGRLYGLLMTRSAYTPVAQTKHNIRLGIQRNVS